MSAETEHQVEQGLSFGNKVLIAMLAITSVAGGGMTVGLAIGQFKQSQHQFQNYQIETGQRLDEVTVALTRAIDLFEVFTQQGERWTYEEVLDYWKDCQSAYLRDPSSFWMPKPTKRKFH